MTSSLKTLLASGLVRREDSPFPAGDCPSESILPFGIPEIDAALPHGGIEQSKIHEWTSNSLLVSKALNRWVPPLIIPALLLGNTLSQEQRFLFVPNVIIWIGRACWPTPFLIKKAKLDQCKHLFIDVSDKENILWGIIQALQSKETFAVIANIHNFSFAASKRILLAVQKSTAFCFLLRPPWEYEIPSCAYSRWIVSPTQSLDLEKKRAKSNTPKLFSSPAEESFRWELCLSRLKSSLRCTHSGKVIAPPYTWPLIWQRGLKDEYHALCLDSQHSASHMPEEDSKTLEHMGGERFTLIRA